MRTTDGQPDRFQSVRHPIPTTPPTASGGRDAQLRLRRQRQSDEGRSARPERRVTTSTIRQPPGHIRPPRRSRRIPPGTRVATTNDALGREGLPRSSRDPNPVTTSYVDGSTFAGALNFAATYTHGPSIDEPLSVKRGHDFVFRRMPSAPSSGRSRPGTNSTYQYDSYGRIVVSRNCAAPYAFTGRERLRIRLLLQGQILRPWSRKVHQRRSYRLRWRQQIYMRCRGNPVGYAGSFW